MNTLGIRMSVTPEMALANESFTDGDFVCCNNLYDLWLKHHGIEVLEKTFGVHLKSGRRQHFHIHYILGNDFKFKTRPLQKIKYDLLETTVPDKTLQPYVSAFEKFEKGCISMKCKKIPFMEESDLTFNNKRFCAYPFKERYAIPALCKTSYDIKELEDLAASEYEATQVKREKAINATIKTQGHQQHVRDYLDSKNYNSFSNPVTIIHDALYYFKQMDYPFFKTGQHALQFTYDNGQLPLENIINKLLPGLKDTGLSILSADGDLPSY